MYITFESDPVASDVAALFEGISRETFRKTGLAAPRFFAFMLRDDKGRVRGGVNGLVYYGALYVDQIFVAESLQGQGHGRKLMDKVEGYAWDENCGFIHLVTMSWEAQGFYEACGYALEFTRDGYAQGGQCHGMIKRLSPL